MKAYTFHFCS